MKKYHLFIPHDARRRPAKHKWIASTRYVGDALRIAQRFERSFISLVSSNSPYMRKTYTVWRQEEDPGELRNAIDLITVRENLMKVKETK